MLICSSWVLKKSQPSYFNLTCSMDVWLGNCRGNKYSCKHLHLKPSDPRMWDFSLDQHALIDVPESVEVSDCTKRHILNQL
jgi:hypothetical protein